MAIKGLTDQAKVAAKEAGLDAAPGLEFAGGRPVRLGFLGKGKREGFGQNIKLHNLDYFRFSPRGVDQATAEKMLAVYYGTYGEKPRELRVHVPVSLLGNFNIQDCAFMVAMAHREKGSYFLAQSDGEVITRYRDDTGQVKVIGRDFEDPIPMDSTDLVRLNEKDQLCFRYNGRLYPFQARLVLDLILPEFNEALHMAGLPSWGVVTFGTTSQNDVANLVAEWNHAIGQVIGLMSNPLDERSVQRAINYTPLRMIPFLLTRRIETISTPGFTKGKEADRLIRDEWLCHLQLHPAFASQMHQAQMAKSQHFLEVITSTGALPAPDRQFSIDDLRDRPALPAKTPAPVPAEIVEPDEDLLIQEEIDEGVYEEFEDSGMGNGEHQEPAENGNGEDLPWATPKPAPESTDDPEKAPAPIDWQDEALKARTLDEFCYRTFQACPDGFRNAGEVKQTFKHLFGNWGTLESQPAAFRALVAFASVVAAGGKKQEIYMAAANKARSQYQAELNQE